MRTFLEDLAFARRALRSDRGTATTAVLVLAAGVALNTTILAMAYGILIQPLPYRDAARLLAMPIGALPATDDGIPLRGVEEWQARMRPVALVAGHVTTQYTFRGVGEPRTVEAAVVTERFFEVLEPPLSAGRAFGRLDSGVVVSERLARQLGLPAADLVGQVVTLANRALPVVGVAPDVVTFPSDQVDLWVPVTDAPIVQFEGDDARRFRLIARIAPGVAPELVRDEARRVLATLAIEQPAVFGGRVASAVPLQEQVSAHARPILLMFVCGAGLVLVVACANAGGLLLTRALRREREIALRLALGAARSRILRSVFAEALLIAAAGAAIGGTLAMVGVRLGGRVAAGLLPRTQELAVDGPVLLASVAAAASVAILCGTAPALHARRTDVASAFRQSTASTTRRARLLFAILVVAQIAASVVLLVGAGLFTRSLFRLLNVDLGIEPRGAVATTLLLTEALGFEAEHRRPFLMELTHQLEGSPGILHAGLGSSFPPQTSLVQVEFRTVSDAGETYSGLLHLIAVTPGYFRALGIPLVSGRLLEPRDGDGGRATAVVSRAATTRLFGTANPIGRRLPAALPGKRTDPPEIVGVVGDVRYGGLAMPPAGTIYVVWEDLPVAAMHLAVRTSLDPYAAAATIRSVVHRIDSRQPVGSIRPVSDVVAGSVVDRRVQAMVLGGFAAFSLALAMVGVVAALARAVIERRRELAIRSALGSGPARTVCVVVLDGAMLVATGTTAGLGLAALVSGGISHQIYGLGPRDPLTYSAAGAITVGAGLLACWLPALRAARISPSEALRVE